MAFEIIKCLKCNNPIYVDYDTFEVTCHNCSNKMKKILYWCKCSHAKIHHKRWPVNGCECCDCTGYVNVKDHIPDYYDDKLR